MKKNIPAVLSQENGRSHKAVKTNWDASLSMWNRILTTRQKKNLLREASKLIVSAPKLCASLQLPVGKRGFQKILTFSGHFRYTKVKKAPPPYLDQFTFRISQIELGKSIYGTFKIGDELHFQMKFLIWMIPLAYSTTDMTFGRRVKCCPEQKNGGDCLMAWGCFQSLKREIWLSNDKIDSKKYNDILASHLVPYTNEHYNSSWIFQQVNARVHTSRHTSQWFFAQKIRVLEWSARSPRGILARKVYVGYR